MRSKAAKVRLDRESGTDCFVGLDDEAEVPRYGSTWNGGGWRKVIRGREDIFSSDMWYIVINEGEQRYEYEYVIRFEYNQNYLYTISTRSEISENCANKCM